MDFRDDHLKRCTDRKVVRLMIALQTEGLLRMVLATEGPREKRLEEPAVFCTAPRDNRIPPLELRNDGQSRWGANAPTRSMLIPRCRIAKVMKNFAVKYEDIVRTYI